MSNEIVLIKKSLFFTRTFYKNFFFIRTQTHKLFFIRTLFFVSFQYIINIQIYNYVPLHMQTEPGSIPGSGEALAKFSRNYAELYWDFNETIARPLSGQEVP